MNGGTFIAFISAVCWIKEAYRKADLLPLNIWYISIAVSILVGVKGPDCILDLFGSIYKIKNVCINLTWTSSI